MKSTFLGYETLATGGQTDHNNGNAGLLDLDTTAISIFVENRNIVLLVPNHDAESSWIDCDQNNCAA